MWGDAGRQGAGVWGRREHGPSGQDSRQSRRVVRSHGSLAPAQTINPPVAFHCADDQIQIPDRDLREPEVIWLLPTSLRFFLLHSPSLLRVILSHRRALALAAPQARHARPPCFAWLIPSHRSSLFCKVHEGRDCVCPGHHCIPQCLCAQCTERTR